MAQKRMIAKKISVSVAVAELPVLGQLLFTWMIIHADDFGLLPGSPKSIKALVIPMVDTTSFDVENLLKQMLDLKIINILNYEGSSYFQIRNFYDHQTLKKDRQPQTILDNFIEKTVPESWKKAEKIMQTKPINVFQMDPNGKHWVPEEKRREDIYILANEKKEQIVDNSPIAATQPVVKKKEKGTGMQKLADALPATLTQPKPVRGIYTNWQDKAFRYADSLGIELKPKDKGRWLKVFKQAETGRKAKNLEQAYSFLVDYTKPISSEKKMLFFFHIYENGKLTFPAAA